MSRGDIFFGPYISQTFHRAHTDRKDFLRLRAYSWADYLNFCKRGDMYPQPLLCGNQEFHFSYRKTAWELKSFQNPLWYSNIWTYAQNRFP